MSDIQREGGEILNDKKDIQKEAGSFTLPESWPLNPPRPLLRHTHTHKSLMHTMYTHKAKTHDVVELKDKALPRKVC